ncbi:MAG: hypothetical protein ACXADY_12940 [Candidatus Hodarchaeales archaeon]|jgi:hypothetical protein
MVSTSKMKKSSTLLGICLALSICFNSYSTVSGYNYDVPDLSSNNTLFSRIIFTGFDHSLMDSLITPSGLYNSYLDNYPFSQNMIGKSFRIYHSFESASNLFDENFYSFLNSSAIPDTLTDNDGTSNRYRRINPREFNYTGRFIPANESINWLKDNYDTYFGNVPSPGYTLIIANMSRLDDESFPQHWYNQSYIDPDSKAILRKNYMIGYGSQNRMYYLDLSADSYYLHDAGENGTLQDMGRMYDFSTEYGLSKLSEYMSEWIYEIERNLWVQDPIYLPLIPIGDVSTGIQYSFDILVINNISNYIVENLSWAINEDYILDTLRELHPLMNMEINLYYVNLTDLPELNSIIHQSLVPWGDFKSLVNTKYTVDLEPVYQHLSAHRNEYLPSPFTSSFYTVQFQTFAFIFDDARFGISEKAQIEPVLLGIALRNEKNSPLTMISQNLDYMYGNRSNPQRTHGLSNTIIHETGRQLSLMHPFQYGEVGNFVDDVMAYYTESSKFSIFSKDNFLRAYTDRLLSYSQIKILQAVQGSRSKVYAPSIVNFFNVREQEYNEIVDAYNSMDYKEAYRQAFILYKSLINFDPEFSHIPDMREYTEIIPFLFTLTAVFAGLTVHYYTRYQVASKGKPKRELFTEEMKERIEEKYKERIIASHQEARKRLEEIQKKDSLNTSEDST